ncbi:hypothetical protein WX45_01775 [Clostridium ljungdahlii DSM 13528]|uniref:Uncharacterized protein n=1 Tax=Clostridium ljungdahlii (strain ATCC 55383 / DSM 13528 / PETC) TaxID=748727 RepID=D8GQP0_CLOLD|nr:hypothetical protein [Clostridium ljungdahlii]ADK16195.1 conserved hypothetical protein [Clostridium ljungdahlii DSM 13528]OAA89936.1 hypothetical protein WX45_01775 [Clostridium ljungdahlii DSM 13528]
MKKLLVKIFIVFSMALLFGLLPNSNAQAATVGQQLTAPESGWQRFDDTNTNITYDSTFVLGSSTTSLNYLSTEHNSSAVNSKIRFNFTGNKLRIINRQHPNRSKNIEISIDGISYGNVIENSTNDIPFVICFENSNLSNKEHYVEIVNLEDGYQVLDAIDIDSTGKLKPYNENPQGTTPTNPTDNIGNAILNLTMTNGNVKSYTVSMSKLNDFISWYNNRSSGSNGSPYYAFDKTDSSQPFSKKTEYVVFDKISSFEVDEYTKQ